MSFSAFCAFAWFATATLPGTLSPGGAASPGGLAAPVTGPDASPLAVGHGPREKAWIGPDVAVITMRSDRPRIKADTHQGVIFDLDFKTLGAVSLADDYANLHTEPKDLTLSFSPPDPMLTARYDKGAKALGVYLKNSAGKPLCDLPFPLSTGPARFLIQQRNQLALFAISADGGSAALAWSGTVHYLVTLRAVDQYGLCTGLKITMGRRGLTLDSLRDGVPLDSLDQIGDITVTGKDPQGEAFTHRYRFDYAYVEKLVTGALIALIHHQLPGPFD